MSQQYANQQAVSATTSSFVASLVSNIAIAGGEILGFAILHSQFKAIYEPRSYMPLDVRRRVHRLRRNWVMTFWQIWSAEDEEVLKRNGMDAYVFLRFLRMMLKIILPIWLLSWVILLPVDAAGTSVSGKKGLDRFTFGNINPNSQARYWAHLILAWTFDFWVLYNLWVEMRKWIPLRQRHLINPAHSRLAQANTVLITGIHKSLLDEVKLAQLFSHLPGGVKKIWLNRNLKEMPDLYERRTKASAKLEDAQNTLIKLARTLRVKAEKEQAKHADSSSEKPNDPQEIAQNPSFNKDILVEGKPSPSVITLQDAGADISFVMADKLVPREKRPTHRLPPKRFPFALPFLGKKVDTIDWCRQEIVRTSQALERSRQTLRSDIEKPGTEGEMYPPLNSAFIYFHQQIAAHMANQILLHDQPYRMNRTYTEMSPEEVIWSNLSMNQYEANIRLAISWAITGGLVILWTFPSAFIGAMSNATQLCAQYRWMEWLCQQNKTVKGIISGLLPPILLALLNLVLPIILKQLAQFEGIPKKTGLELSLMTRYTIFLVVVSASGICSMNAIFSSVLLILGALAKNSFLIVTLAAGLIAALPQIGKNPSSVATILATQLPNASTFFLTYVMLQAAGAAGNLLQPISLTIYIIKLILLGGTPRSSWKLRYQMQTPTWGQAFPNVTIVAIITITYMVISPIINGLAFAAFFLIYEISKYLYIWVDTGGAFFPKAINHVFVGLYIQQVAQCALFFLAQNSQRKQSSVPQGALMVVLIVLTAAVHYTINNSYKPLEEALPLSLARYSYGMSPEGPEDEQSLLEPGYDPRPQRSKSDKQVLPGESQASPNDIEMARFAPPDGLDAEEARKGFVDAKADPRDGLENEKLPGNEDSTGSDETLSNTKAGVPHPDTDRDSGESGMAGKAPPQKVDRVQSEIGTEDIPELHQAAHDGETLEENAFSHPATYRPARIIWLPVDELGLGPAETHDNLALGIPTSTQDATLSSDGKVKISAPPPDERE